MAKTYEVNGMTRFANRTMAPFIRAGMMPGPLYLLTVRGRTSGKLYSTPVALVVQEDRRYVVSPYGIVSWVKNARASGEVTLERGRVHETLRIRELPPEEAAPILRTYITRQSVTRPYFDVTVDSPLEAFAAEAPAHPVFELLPLAG